MPPTRRDTDSPGWAVRDQAATGCLEEGPGGGEPTGEKDGRRGREGAERGEIGAQGRSAAEAMSAGFGAMRRRRRGVALGPLYCEVERLVVAPLPGGAGDAVPAGLLVASSLWPSEVEMRRRFAGGPRKARDARQAPGAT